MKKLRYMIEFARPLAQKKPFARMADALKTAQKALGVIHDRIAAEQMLVRLVADNADARFLFAANIFRDELAAPADCAERAREAHAALRGSAPFWK